MTRPVKLASVVGALAAVCLLGAVVARAQKGVVFVDSAKAQFTEVRPGAQSAALWGDRESGPHGSFTKFDPGVTHAMHSHTNDLRIVVIRGAYLYKPQNGEEKRVGAGSYLFIPGGDVHVSGGDPKEGALFYQETAGKFDINFVGQK